MHNKVTCEENSNLNLNKYNKFNSRLFYLVLSVIVMLPSIYPAFIEQVFGKVFMATSVLGCLLIIKYLNYKASNNVSNKEACKSLFKIVGLQWGWFAVTACLYLLLMKRATSALGADFLNPVSKYMALSFSLLEPGTITYAFIMAIFLSMGLLVVYSANYNEGKIKTLDKLLIDSNNSNLKKWRINRIVAFAYRFSALFAGVVPIAVAILALIDAEANNVGFQGILLHPIAFAAISLACYVLIGKKVNRALMKLNFAKFNFGLEILIISSIWFFVLTLAYAVCLGCTTLFINENLPLIIKTLSVFYGLSNYYFKLLLMGWLTISANFYALAMLKHLKKTSFRMVFLSNIIGYLSIFVFTNYMSNNFIFNLLNSLESVAYTRIFAGIIIVSFMLLHKNTNSTHSIEYPGTKTFTKDHSIQVPRKAFLNCLILMIILISLTGVWMAQLAIVAPTILTMVFMFLAIWQAISSGSVEKNHYINSNYAIY